MTMYDYLKKNKIEFFVFGILLSPWLSFGGRQIYSAHIIVIFSLIMLLKSKKIIAKVRTVSPVVRYFFFYWLAKLFISGFTINTSLNKYTIIYLFMFSLVFTMLFVLDTDKKVMSAITAFKIFVLITALLGILEFLTSFRLPFSLYMLRDFSIYNTDKLAYLMKQPTVFYFNPNDFSTCLVIGLGLYVGGLKSAINKTGTILSITVISIAILFSNSRGNTLAMLLILGVGIVTQVNLNKVKMLSLKKKIVILLLFIFLLVALWNPLYKMYKQLFELSISLINGSMGSSVYASNRERWQITVNASEMIRTNFFGVGPGMGRLIIGSQMNAASLDMHNWILEIWGDFGSIFILCFILFNLWIYFKLVRIFRNSIRPRVKYSASALLLSKIAMIISMISPSSLVYFIPYWFQLGLILCFINTHSKECKCISVKEKK